MATWAPPAPPTPPDGVALRQFVDEDDLPLIMSLVDEELSEPYSIFTYRYFICTWPKLCYMAMAEGRCVGVVVCKLDRHREQLMRGYIAMLVVDKPFRKRQLGRMLVQHALHQMVVDGAEEVVLEAEVQNYGALRLYEQLGFIRDKRLQRYYLSGIDAYRLKLLLPQRPNPEGTADAAGAVDGVQQAGEGDEDDGDDVVGADIAGAAAALTVRPLQPA